MVSIPFPLSEVLDACALPQYYSTTSLELLVANMIIYCLVNFLSQTPLHIAAQQGDMKKVTSLVDNGDSVHTTDKQGVSETMLIAEDN